MLRDLCTVSILGIKLRGSAEHTDSKSPSFFVLSELKSLLLNCKMPWRGSAHWSYFPAELWKRKVIPSLLCHLCNAIVWLIQAMWYYVRQGNCLLRASTEIKLVIFFSRQFSLQHPVLHFLTIRIENRMVWIMAISLSKDKFSTVNSRWVLLMTEVTF